MAKLYPFIAAAIILAALSTSCSPRIYERIVYQRDTTYIDKLQVDSVAIRDSVFVKQVRDTVIIYKEKIREKYKYLRDTITVVKDDSMASETIKEVEVTKPLTWWQRFRQGAFWWLLLANVGLLAWTFRKYIAKLFII